MRAVVYSAAGAAREVLRLEDRPQPHPAAGELRIRVQASGINPSDVKSRARRAPAGEVIPHSDGAGVVDAVGAGVQGLSTGQRVWFCNAQWQRPQGSAAEYVVLPQELVFALPDAVEMERGACLGIPALTAWEAVHGEGPVQGQTLLVQGGAGAVGQAAIQLAVRAGARVITTVSSGAKAELARQAGAHAVVDYRHEDLAAAVHAFTAGRGLDRLIEINLSANAGAYTRLLKRGGSVCVVGSDDWTQPLPLSDFLVHGLTLRFFIVYELSPERRRAAAADLRLALEAGQLRHAPVHSYALADCAAAHEAVERGLHLGQVVVKP